MYDVFQNLDQKAYFIIAALIISAVFSYFTGKWGKSLWSPIWRFFAHISLFFDTKLNKVKLARGELFFRGLIALVFLLVVVFLALYVLQALPFKQNINDTIELIVLILILSPLSSIGVNSSVYASLKQNSSYKGIYYCLARDTRTDLNAFDESGIIRFLTLMSAIHLERAVFGPIFYYLAFGMHGALIYIGVNAFFVTNGAFGYDKAFSKCGHFVSWIMNIIPGYITAITLVLAAAFTPMAKMRFALKAIFSGEGHAPWGYGGVGATVIAYAFGITLGGPGRSLNGQQIQPLWIGQEGSTAQLKKEHIKHIVLMQLSSLCILVLGVLSLLLI